MISTDLNALPAAHDEQVRHSDTDWFMAARWGLMCHYLESPASSETPSLTSADDWNRRVDGFDVAGFAAQVESVGAGYVLFTIGQNSGHFCAPNAVYDSFVGRSPSLCSRRDLIAEIAEALARVGVRTLAYLPSGAPECDSFAVEALEWQKGAYRLSSFQRRWEEVIREWSDRWGTRISGWWIDGCYYAEAMYAHPEPPNFPSFTAALRSGNGQSIIAYNPGVRTPIAPLTPYEDYTAGEINLDFPTANKWSAPSRFVDGAQYHVLSFLGDWWGEGQPRFSTAFMAGFTSDVNSRQGVVTWDVPIGISGTIDPLFIEHLQQMTPRSR